MAEPSLPWRTLLFYGLLLFQIGERLFELRIARRNRRWAMAQGGREFGPGHYRIMVLLHTTFLAACALEPVLLPTWSSVWLTCVAALAVLMTNGLRYWVIFTLGRLWNTRVICVPGAQRVTGGPFRFIRHPNYVAVVVELFALPLVHGAWRTALAFGVANLALLAWRIRVEDAALKACYGEAPA